MVQKPYGKSSQVLGSRLIRGRDLDEWVRKGSLRRARYSMLRNVAKVILVHLQRNVVDMYPKKHGTGTHWSTRLSLYGKALDLPNIREHICGVLSLVKGSPMVER